MCIKWRRDSGSRSAVCYEWRKKRSHAPPLYSWIGAGLRALYTVHVIGASCCGYPVYLAMLNKLNHLGTRRQEKQVETERDMGGTQCRKNYRSGDYDLGLRPPLLHGTEIDGKSWFPALFPTWGEGTDDKLHDLQKTNQFEQLYCLDKQEYDKVLIMHAILGNSVTH